jgi:hypothetical protein
MGVNCLLISHDIKTQSRAIRSSEILKRQHMIHQYYQSIADDVNYKFKILLGININKNH